MPSTNTIKENTPHGYTKTMTVSIVGVGFVGSALSALFTDAVLFDRFKRFPTTREQVNQTDVAFLCLPTPNREDGTCDTSAIEEVMSWIETPIIVLRSTVTPGTTASLVMKYPQKTILYMPEFLREKTAVQDTLKPSRIVIAGPHEAGTKVLSLMYERLGHYPPTQVTDYKTAELVKLATNAYLSMKVGFVNELHQIASFYHIDWDLFKDAFLLDSRIGNSHMDPNGTGGFGGHCFPKDITMLVKTADTIGTPAPLLKAVKGYIKQ